MPDDKNKPWYPTATEALRERPDDRLTNEVLQPLIDKEFEIMERHGVDTRYPHACGMLEGAIRAALTNLDYPQVYPIQRVKADLREILARVKADLEKPTKSEFEEPHAAKS